MGLESDCHLAQRRPSRHLALLAMKGGREWIISNCDLSPDVICRAVYVLLNEQPD